MLYHTTENVKRCKSPGIDEILAEQIKAGGEILYSEILKLINYIWKMKGFSTGRSLDDA
jgi:hypothetical protein